MASFVVNALQVNFESVLIMDDAGMVKMFRSLDTSEGMVRFSGLPSKAVADMKKMLFSVTDAPFKPSNKKKNMKVEYRLLHDIVAKSLSTKAGSFDVTLAAMVSTPGKKSRGYAIPLSFLLEKLVKPDLGESVALHPLKVLNHKSDLTYMKKNQVAPQAATVNMMRDDQTYMNQIFRRAFYKKMDEVVTSVNTSQTELETNLVRQFEEIQQHFASDVALVKL
ncbi:hypothetical protein F511_29288 [Dorcoceras hygrometricum]|uniref:Uncharacterized protein n=1 Tax=Dorcoceras hygrometricum TaxID=472368 RepID=A0A2Z7D104_9LAMI|nr:hypothetical protein F511_29288 [Dorcoceras hygrometricum]